MKKVKIILFVVKLILKLLVSDSFWPWPKFKNVSRTLSFRVEKFYWPRIIIKTFRTLTMNQENLFNDFPHLFPSISFSNNSNLKLTFFRCWPPTTIKLEQIDGFSVLIKFNGCSPHKKISFSSLLILLLSEWKPSWNIC